MKNNPVILSILLFLFSSCANQLPPGGGDDDNIPPKISYIYPSPNTTSFTDNKLIFRFDEYVDRRSFEESFSISPRPKGEVSFSWGGKEVEVEFSRPLDKNKTYLVIIGNELKDVRGSNPIGTPFTFAFSTGSRIDKGEISGRVFADAFERVKVLAFRKDSKSPDKLDPSKETADYVIQPNPDGSFSLTNLPPGEYRIFALTDEDRNNLFGADMENLSVSFTDYTLATDTSAVSGVDLLIADPGLVKSGRDILSLLKTDSAGFIFSNITNGDLNVPADYRMYFYFKTGDISKPDIVNNFSIRDSAAGKTYSPVFNWINDSLLEVFSTEKFQEGSNLAVTIDLTGTSKNYLYVNRFKVAGRNSTGKLTGSITSDTVLTFPIILKLYSKTDKFISYTRTLDDTTGFEFSDIPEGSYLLIAFVDENGNGQLDRGSGYPFRASEKFLIYGQEIKIKGGWTTDNVFLKF